MDIVDERDKVVGVSTLEQCVQDGILHRAVAVVLARSSGKVLLQRRSKSDSWQAGRWTLSCTGHVRRGESYEAAGLRELEEELSIRPGITKLKKYLLPPIKEGELTEREWVTLFAAESDDRVKIDPVELDSVEEFTRPELIQLLGGERVTPDAVILLTEYLRLRPAAP